MSSLFSNFRVYVWYLGVLLGIPVYASAKVVIPTIFSWYKKSHGLYEEEEEIK